MTIDIHIKSRFWRHFAALILYLIWCTVGFYMIYYALKEDISLLNMIIGIIGLGLIKPNVTINNKHIRNSFISISVEDNVQD